MIEIKHSYDLVKTSYKEDDVTILLKDLTSSMKELSTEERERAIQSGVHYSEMLPLEKAPSDEYMALYRKVTTDKDLKFTADLIGIIAEMMYRNTSGTHLSGRVPVIISLARAGIPVGILIKRRLKQRYNIDCPHYAISIIRDKGIDTNAMNYIYDREVIFHGNGVDNFFFVDGWTGKGAIKNQLDDAVEQLKSENDKWKKLSSDLYVLADPANITDYCGTKTDYLLPSACLNSTISGLISRTILNDKIDLEKNEFHGAVYFSRFEDIDISNEFIDGVSKYLNPMTAITSAKDSIEETGMQVVNRVCKDFNIEDYKKVKPGVGETTRVLLRRVPWKVLIDTYDGDPDVEHIIHLCKEKNITIEKYNLGNYKVCGIIKKLSADA